MLKITARQYVMKVKAEAEKEATRWVANNIARAVNGRLEFRVAALTDSPRDRLLLRTFTAFARKTEVDGVTLDVITASNVVDADVAVVTQMTETASEVVAAFNMAEAGYAASRAEPPRRLRVIEMFREGLSGASAISDMWVSDEAKALGAEGV